MLRGGLDIGRVLPQVFSSSDVYETLPDIGPLWFKTRLQIGLRASRCEAGSTSVASAGPTRAHDERFQMLSLKVKAIIWHMSDSQGQVLALAFR